MKSTTDLIKEIEKIKERNRRVEKDKAWETSWTRRISVATVTYLLISIFLSIIKVDRPLLAAIIPSIAYLTSTATLSFLKGWWLKQNK